MHASSIFCAAPTYHTGMSHYRYILLTACVFLCFPTLASANHFRSGAMSWVPVVGQERTVLIKVDNVWTNNHGFVSSSTAVGAIDPSATFELFFGDGTSANVSLRVTSRDATSNDVQTEVVYQSGATWLSGIRHTYASDGNYTVYWGSGSRESATGQASSNWRNEMILNIGNGNTSPVAAVPAVIQVQDDTIFRYDLSATDANGDEVRFRRGTRQEFYDTGSSSGVALPTGLTLSSTGSIRWDVRNSTITTSSGNRWQMALMVEDLTETGAVKSKIPLDFVLVISNNTPPQFISYPVGIQTVETGASLMMTLKAIDPVWRSNYSSPTLTVLNPPSTTASVWTGSVVRSGSAATVTTTFNPTTAMAGQSFVILFRATSGSGATAVQAVNVRVPQTNQPPVNISISSSSIIERSATNSLIGTLSVTDPDGDDTHTLTLTGSTNTNIFALSGAQLRIANGSLALSGSYTVSVHALDSVGNEFEKDLTIRLLRDEDDDGYTDVEDTFIGEVEDIDTGTSGMPLTMNMNGNSASGTYTGSRSIVISLNSQPIVTFAKNFSSGSIRAANLLIVPLTNSLVVNLGSEVPAGTRKTLFIDDNNFTSFCVKDAAVTSIDDVSAGCTGSGEIIFDSCLGSSSPVTISGISCVDLGSRLQVSNLEHSALRGTPPVVVSGGTSGGGGGGGSGGGGYRGELGNDRITEAIHTLGPLHPAATASGSSSSAVKDEQWFKDVPSTAWFAKAVNTLHRLKIVSGYATTDGGLTRLYGPDKPVTYGELAKMLLLTAGGGEMKASGSPQQTALQFHWSAPYLKVAQNRKLSIYLEASLNPDKPAPRGDVALAIKELFKLNDAPPYTGFTDLPTTHPRAKALYVMHAYKLMMGDNDAQGNPLNVIRADAPVNRAEVASILMRILDYSLEELAESSSISSSSSSASPQASTSSSSAATVSTGTRSRVTSMELHLRTDARATSYSMGTLSKGTEVTVLYVQENGWARIKTDDGREAFVFAEFLESVE